MYGEVFFINFYCIGGKWLLFIILILMLVVVLWRGVQKYIIYQKLESDFFDYNCMYNSFRGRE